MGAPIALSTATLGGLPAEVAVPAYDRAGVTPGMVHFGVGGFFRAHQAMYLERSMNAGHDHDFGIVGVGTMPGDARMRDAMKAQDCLYTLVVKHPDGSRDAQVIGSMIGYLFAPGDPQAVLDRLADPATRIVSLTVTEGGYHVNQVTGEFDPKGAALRGRVRPSCARMTCSAVRSASLTQVASGLVSTCKSSALKRVIVTRSTASARTWASRRSSS